MGPSISAEAIRKITDFTQQNCYNTSWAFAASSIQDHPLFDAIASAARATITEFESHNFEVIVWSFAVLRMADNPLLQALSAQARKLITSAGSVVPSGIFCLPWLWWRLSVKEVVDDSLVHVGSLHGGGEGDGHIEISLRRSVFSESRHRDAQVSRV